MLADAWRLAVGTLTIVRLRPPARVDRSTAALAALLAPIAVVPLGLAVALVLVIGERASLNGLTTGLLAVGVLLLGTRALHVDGLSDVADGLTASYDRERSLAVMKIGTSGPAGVAATVVVLGLQAVGFATLVGDTRSAVVAGLVVCVSRCALATACVRGVPSARPDGLGAAFAGTVAVPTAVVSWLLGAAALLATGHATGLSLVRCGVAVAVAVVVVVLLLVRCRSRFGGVTGDVFGAAIEVALAALLVVL